jgi:L-alanine-DL-glutamate epimerase-like enolase superfamily enzyme
VKITEVRTSLISTRWGVEDPYWNGGDVKSSALVLIETDEGIRGIGESLLGYFAPETVPPLVDYYAPLLVGRDPDDIDGLWRQMFKSSYFWGRTGAAMSVISAIDIALWDIRAQRAGRPLYSIVGTLARSSQLIYASGGGSLWPLERTVEKVQAYADLGYRAAKVAIGSAFNVSWDPLMGHRFELPTTDRLVELEAEKWRRLRDAMGQDFELLTQSSGPTPWTLAHAIRFAEAMAPAHLLWYEEPFVYERLHDYQRLRARSSTPIAGGESFSGVQTFQQFLEAEAFDIIQPDLTYVGGITVGLKIAALAEAYGTPVAFHVGGSFGPGFAASLHLSLVTPHVLILEQPPAAAGVQAALCTFPLTLKAGSIEAPLVPGLGVALTPEIERRFAFVPGSGERE